MLKKATEGWQESTCNTGKKGRAELRQNGKVGQTASDIGCAGQADERNGNMRLWQLAERGFPKCMGVWKVNFSAGRVLKAAALLKDENICDEIKRRAALNLLLCRPWSWFAGVLPAKKQEKLLDRLTGQLCGQSLSGGKTGGGARLIAFDRDGPLIYAALLQCYGIDLMKDKTDWRIIPALLAGVSENTRLYRVMEIRAMELPAHGEADEREIQRIRRLKQAYSLDEQALHSGLNQLFDRLSGVAGR